MEVYHNSRLRIALAIVIKRNQPADVSLREYVSSVLERIDDPSYFWRRRYNQKINEMARMQAELSELEGRLGPSNKMSVGKLKKRKINDGINHQWRLIDDMLENEDEDTRKIKSVVELLKTGDQLEKSLCLEAGRMLLGHLKMWKYEDDEIFKLAFPILVKTFNNFVKNKYYVTAKSFFASIIEWFYEQFAHALKIPIVVYCHDCIAGLISIDRIRYIGSIEICKLLTKKRTEVAQPAILNRESKKQQLLSAYYYFISILRIANNVPPSSNTRHLIEVKELQKHRREMEKAFLENKDKFIRIANELCLINWKLL